MYNDDLEDEQEEQGSSNFFVNFYYNNKVLVWIAAGIIIFIILMSLLTKGSKNSSSSPTEYTVDILPKGEVVVAIGKSTNLNAIVTNVSQPEISWSVDNEDIVKVDKGSGNVVGLKYGKATVTATYLDNNNEPHSQTKEITVANGNQNIIVTDVTFKNGDLFMPLNSVYDINLVVVPSNGFITNETYTSSNTKVVTVDDTGRVTAVGEGETTIAFDVNNGDFKGNLHVYVDRNYKTTEIIVTPTKISFDGELRKIKVGTSEKLTYTVEPDDTDKTKLIWTSSDEKTVSVDENGWITALKPGPASITLSSINGEKDKIDIEVETDFIPVSNISLSVNEMYLTVGQNKTITPIVSPDNASNKALSYSSSNTSVAVPVPNGTGTQATIYGISEGYASITIRSGAVEKILVVKVSKVDDNNNENGNNSSEKQRFKMTSKDVYGDPHIVNSYAGTDNNGATAPVTITVQKTDSSISKLKVVTCSYPVSSSCTSTASGAITVTSSSTFTMRNTGYYVLRVFEYDSSNNIVRTTDKYIWIKATAESTTKPTITCINPTYNGSSQIIATCNNGKFSNGLTSMYKIDVGSYYLTCTGTNGSTTSKTCFMKSGSSATNTPKPSTPIITCTNPTYNGSSQVIATCSNGKFSNGLTSVSKTDVGSYNLTCTGTNGSTTNKTCSMNRGASATNTPKPSTCSISNCNKYLCQTSTCCKCSSCKTGYDLSLDEKKCYKNLMSKPAESSTSTQSIDAKIYYENYQSITGLIDDAVYFNILADKPFDYVFFCVESESSGCQIGTDYQVRPDYIYNIATPIKSYFHPFIAPFGQQCFDPAYFGLNIWTRADKLPNTNDYNVKILKGQRLWIFLGKVSGGKLTEHSKLFYHLR